MLDHYRPTEHVLVFLDDARVRLSRFTRLVKVAA
jgi:hypothetical protein